MQQVILLDKGDVATLKAGQLLTLSFGNGTSVLVGMNGFLSHNGTHARNGHAAPAVEPAADVDAPTTTERTTKRRATKRGAKRRKAYTRRQWTDEQKRAIIARVRGADFDKLKGEAAANGVSIDRLRVWAREVGVKLLPTKYTCHECRPPVSFSSGQSYSGHMRAHGLHGKVLRRRAKATA